MSLSCACLGPQNGEPYCPCEMKRFKEMSVKELIFKTECEKIISFKYEDNTLKFYDLAFGNIPWEFNREEAHLLMLYLQEHLK